MSIVKKITEDLLCFHSKGLIDLNRKTPGTESQSEYYYAHLPLTIIDAVFSKGQAYSATAKVVNNYCSHYNLTRNRPSEGLPPPEDQESVTQFVKKSIYEGEHYFRTEILKSPEPVAYRFGAKSKTMAVLDLADLLREYDVEYFQDMGKILYDDSFAARAIEVTGMSNNCLNYFFMLAGSDAAPRPVRLTIDFINGITGRDVSVEYSAEIVNEVSERLREKFQYVTPRMLGFLIWDYMKRTKYDMPN